MSYSPDGNSLAVGSHDNRIRIYDVENGYKKIGECAKHTSFVHCLDWSTDSEGLRSVCGGYELLFWNKDGSQLPGGASSFKDEKWASQTCKFGWWVDGIYPSGCDGTHINGTARSPDEKLIVTADDWGMVNLFRNPCRMGCNAKSYRAHSEHVVRAQFDQEQKNVYSIGGYDKALIHWKMT